MIPLKDSVRPKKYPYVNITLIFLNLAIFIYQLTLDKAALVDFFYQYGVIPQNFLALQGGTFLPFLTSMFLHGGWFHLLGNMLYLWVFGDNVEDRIGHSGYLLFYLVAGTAGSLSHIAANPQSAVPTIGASGAIAGILGAYFIFFPRAKVLTLIPIGIFITTAYLPAYLFLILWFLLQVFNAFLSGLSTATETVAWWAHIGGFVLGFAVGIFTLIRQRIFD